jgi:hypothetical protein
LTKWAIYPRVNGLRWTFAAELRICEADTARLLNPGAAVRLAGWRRYEDDPVELVAFVQRVLRGPHRANGWELHRKGGRSLEQIVIDFGSPPFTQDDIRTAKETLGSKKISLLTQASPAAHRRTAARDPVALDFSSGAAHSRIVDMPGQPGDARFLAFAKCAFRRILAMKTRSPNNPDRSLAALF